MYVDPPDFNDDGVVLVGRRLGVAAVAVIELVERGHPGPAREWRLKR